ncbi:hypothetical protein DB30_01798 [Enhygromyxa salina]|uniref:Uncharacterized protein n=1 Tax=Enhygromyxa salina TaxID=215803 RepID=A0A0C2CRD3_9BACT|nr:hypothetical protein DB30_01798 [Enhygromyxa salina]
MVAPRDFFRDIGHRRESALAAAELYLPRLRGTTVPANSRR